MKLRRLIAVALLVGSIGGVAWCAEAENATKAEVPEASPETSPSPIVQPAGSGELAAQVKSIEVAIVTLQETSSRDSATTAEALSAIKSSIAALEKRMETLREVATEARPTSGPDPHTSRALEQIDTRISGLERLLVPGGDAANTAFPYPRLAAIFAGLAAGLGVVAIVSIFWARPSGRGGGAIPGSVTKQLGEIQKAVAALAESGAAKPAAAAGGKGDADTASALVQSANALRGTVDKATRENKELSGLVEQFQGIAGSLQQAADGLGTRLSEIEQARASLSEERTTVEKNRAELAAKSADVQSEIQQELQSARATVALYDAFWPEAFQGDGPLASWKARVMQAFEKGNAEAGRLLATLIDWKLLQREEQPERDRWVEAVDAVGRSCHAFLAQEPAADETEALERGQQWTRAFKTALEEAFPSLKLSAAYPGDRFDTDRMEAVGSTTSGRQTVQRALSWMILEKTAESTHILCRAQVITA